MSASNGTFITKSDGTPFNVADFFAAIYDSASGYIRTDSTPIKGAALVTAPAVTISAVILAANAARKAAMIVNNSAVDTLYISQVSPVTSANGIPIAPKQAYIDQDTVAAWYGISGGGSIDARIIEIA